MNQNYKDRNNLRVIGISDSLVTETALHLRFGRNYTNYQYHQEPFLDITKPSRELFNSADIVVCSEVLEHVPSPIERGFEGLYKLIRPEGTLVLSVPHKLGNQPHQEHFQEFKWSELREGPEYVGETHAGERIIYDKLVFHGGEGSTLEHRIFSESSLKHYLTKAGFERIEKLENNRIHGIAFEPWSRVWLARKPLLPLDNPRN